MKKLLFRLSFFLIILIMLSKAAHLLVPYHWGNVWYSSKLRSFNADTSRYNAVFFGSSRVYRQIDPLIFDRTVESAGGKQLRSYNLGAPATFSPQVYYLYEKFLERESKSRDLKYAFIELMEIDVIGDDLLHQERVTYWQNSSDLAFVSAAVDADPYLSDEQRRVYRLHYGESWFEGWVGLGHFRDQILNAGYYSETYAGSGRRGFYPLEEEMLVTQSAEQRRSLAKNRAALLSKPALLRQRAESSAALLTEKQKVNEVHLRRLNDLIALSQSKGIQLIFVLSPRNVTKGVAGLFQSLDPAHRLSLANAELYPEFYSPEGSFDAGHMKTNASRRYSAELGRNAVKVLN
jgi:hypothetical protein